jgi:hypothetical protein
MVFPEFGLRGGILSFNAFFEKDYCRATTNPGKQRKHFAGASL